MSIKLLKCTYIYAKSFNEAFPQDSFVNVHVAPRVTLLFPDVFHNFVCFAVSRTVLYEMFVQFVFVCYFWGVNIGKHPVYILFIHHILDVLYLQICVDATKV